MSAHHNQHLSSVNCDVRIIRAKNTEFKSNGHLFVRCYLSSGNKSRVRLNSQEISSKSNLFWNQTFSLDCLGTKDSIDMLKQESTVIFELRHRSPVFGSLVGSQLLGRAEISWKTVFESPEMEIEKWVPMVSKSGRVHGDFKPPAVKIAMKVRVPVVGEEGRRERGVRKGDERCGCTDCGGGCNFFPDYDAFALALALEAF